MGTKMMGAAARGRNEVECTVDTYWGGRAQCKLPDMKKRMVEHLKENGFKYHVTKIKRDKTKYYSKDYEYEVVKVFLD